MRRSPFWLVLAATATLAIVPIVMAAALAMPPGHRPLHVGCTHQHGPTRTEGTGRLLRDAQELNRLARQRMP